MRDDTPGREAGKQADGGLPARTEEMNGTRPTGVGLRHLRTTHCDAASLFLCQGLTSSGLHRRKHVKLRLIKARDDKRGWHCPWQTLTRLSAGAWMMPFIISGSIGARPRGPRIRRAHGNPCLVDTVRRLVQIPLNCRIKMYLARYFRRAGTAAPAQRLVPFRGISEPGTT